MGLQQCFKAVENQLLQQTSTLEIMIDKLTAPFTEIIVVAFAWVMTIVTAFKAYSIRE